LFDTEPPIVGVNPSQVPFANPGTLGAWLPRSYYFFAIAPISLSTSLAALKASSPAGMPQ
jgi:hypothetical protein